LSVVNRFNKGKGKLLPGITMHYDHVTDNIVYSYSELLGTPFQKSPWLLSFELKIQNLSSNQQRTKILVYWFPVGRKNSCLFPNWIL